MVIPNLRTSNQSINTKGIKRKRANPKISAALLYFPCRTSGAMYSLSPSRSNPSPFGLGQTDAIPKSPIFSLPSEVTKMFAGFRSRWRIPLSWMNIMPFFREKKKGETNFIKTKPGERRNYGGHTPLPALPRSSRPALHQVLGISVHSPTGSFRSFRAHKALSG